MATRSSGVADEEGAHLVDELAGLPGLAHRLHEVRERVKVAADEADDELVVAGIEAVAGQANVVRELLGAVGHPDLRVLAQDLRLLVRLEPGEGAPCAGAGTRRASGTPRRVTFSTGRRRSDHSRSGSWPGRVRAAEHRRSSGRRVDLRERARSANSGRTLRTKCAGSSLHVRSPMPRGAIASA